MSSATSFNFSPLEKKYLGARHRSHSCLPQIITTISKLEYCNSTTYHLHSTSVNLRGRPLKAANGPPPVAPIPSGSPSSGWSKWMLLTLIPLLFSFSKSKWGPLLVIKQQFDRTLATVDVMADVIEDIAERVDKIADDISEKLPGNSSLKNAIDMVGDLAEKTDKAAECVDDLLDKVQAAEDRLEKLIEEEKHIEEEKAKEEGSETSPKVKK